MIRVIIVVMTDSQQDELEDKGNALYFVDTLCNIVHLRRFNNTEWNCIWSLENETLHTDLFTAQHNSYIIYMTP